MALFIDTGHGLSNKARGTFDSGAVGSGTTEAAVVRTLAAEVVAKLQGRLDVHMAPDGFLQDRIKWQAAHLTSKDTLISFHMNSGGGNGTEVLYAATKPYLHDSAAQVSADIAKALNLPDRGAKPDTDAAVGSVGILRVSGIPSILIEFGFIDSPSQVADVLANGADAAVAAILTLMGVPNTPAPAPNPEFAADWARFIAADIYTDETVHGAVVDRDSLAVIICRVLDAQKVGKVI